MCPPHSRCLSLSLSLSLPRIILFLSFFLSLIPITPSLSLLHIFLVSFRLRKERDRAKTNCTRLVSRVDEYFSSGCAFLRLRWVSLASTTSTTLCAKLSSSDGEHQRGKRVKRSYLLTPWRSNFSSICRPQSGQTLSYKFITSGYRVIFSSILVA